MTCITATFTIAVPAPTAEPPKPMPKETVPAKPAPAAKVTSNECSDALEEVNLVRIRRGLRPFARDANLCLAALTAARIRASYLCAGHTANDFACLPQGSSATAAGCAAWDDSWGWGACCTYENWSVAGAAWVRGADGRRYMHLFVR